MNRSLSALFGPICLVAAAAIWGFAFVAQKEGMDHLGPFAFTFGRSILGALFIAVVMIARRTPLTRDVIIGGSICGVVLFAAMQLQQLGLVYTSAGVSGFLTATYVLLVPIIGIAIGNRAGIHVWLGAALALFGLYLICAPNGALHIGNGEWLTLLCALAFAIQILCLGRWAHKADGFALTAVEFAVCAVLSLPFAIAIPSERAAMSLSAVRAALPSLAYVGFLSSGIAYSLQAVAQGRTRPALAAILMSLESVFAVLGGWMLLGEKLTRSQAAGCAIVFAAVLATQFVEARKGRS